MIKKFIKEIFTPPYILMLSSFFLFTLFVNMNKVNADTITVPLSSSVLSRVDTSIIDIATNTFTGDIDLFYYDDGNKQFYFLYKRGNNNWFTFGYGNTDYIQTANTDIACYRASSSSFSPIFCSDYNFSTRYNFIQLLPVLGGSNYSTYNITLIYTTYNYSWNTDYNPQNDYIFTYNNNSFSYNPQNDYLPSMYVLKNALDPPTPPDNYPVLTSFINISLEKLSLICDFIVSNYIYLSIFVIFLFYFIILLFRRLHS